MLVKIFLRYFREYSKKTSNLKVVHLLIKTGTILVQLALCLHFVICKVNFSE